MSSPPKESAEAAELKAGHPPAVKAGGMRIVQHKHEKHEGEETHEEKEKSEETTNSLGDPNPEKQVVQSDFNKVDKNKTPEAVRVSHVKPVPAVQPPHAPAHNKMQIHQPK